MRNKNTHEYPDDIPMPLLKRQGKMMEQYVVDPEHYRRAIKKVVSDKIWMDLIEGDLEKIFRDYWPVFKSKPAKNLSLEREMVRWIGGNLFHFLYEHVLDEIRHAAWTQARKEFEEGASDKRR